MKATIWAVKCDGVDDVHFYLRHKDIDGVLQWVEMDMSPVTTFHRSSDPYYYNEKRFEFQFDLDYIKEHAHLEES